MASPLTVEAYRNYTNDDGGSWSDEQIADAIAVETVAQSNRCRSYDPMPADLMEALKRRVQRNLSMRGQPSIVTRSENGVSFTPTNDPEVRRLEGPYRKVAFG